MWQGESEAWTAADIQRQLGVKAETAMMIHGSRNPPDREVRRVMRERGLSSRTEARRAIGAAAPWKIRRVASLEGCSVQCAAALWKCPESSIVIDDWGGRGLPVTIPVADIGAMRRSLEAMAEKAAGGVRPGRAA